MASNKPKPAIRKQEDNKIATPNKDAVVIETSLSNDDATEINHPQFQAVGIIKGSLKFHDDDQKNPLSIVIGDKEYGIYCATKHYGALTGLRKIIAKTGETTQRLIVYPKVLHLPKKEQPHRLWFQLIGFEVGNYENSISADLKDNEFKICGLWQFIPVCRVPCISIFLNFKQERLDFLKKSDDPTTQAKFMKSTHIPVLWKDSPIRPFRYNPRGGKEQGHSMFVQIKAVFLPERDVFAFVEELGETLEEAPKFMKLSKAVKPQGQKKSSDKPKSNKQKKPKKLTLKSQK